MKGTTLLLELAVRPLTMNLSEGIAGRPTSRVYCATTSAGLAPKKTKKSSTPPATRNVATWLGDSVTSVREEEDSAWTHSMAYLRQQAVHFHEYCYLTCRSVAVADILSSHFFFTLKYNCGEFPWSCGKAYVGQTG